MPAFQRKVYEQPTAPVMSPTENISIDNHPLTLVAPVTEAALQDNLSPSSLHRLLATSLQSITTNDFSEQQALSIAEELLPLIPQIINTAFPENSVIVIRDPEKLLSYEHVGKIIKDSKLSTGNRLIIFTHSKKLNIENLNAEQMANHGWYKKHELADMLQK